LNKQLSSSTTSSTNDLSYTIHPQAVYTSRLLDFKNLSKPKNVNDETENSGKLLLYFI